MPEYIDIHSHSSFDAYNEDREEMIQRLKDNNIWTIGVGVDFESSKKEVELAQAHEGMFATIGLHPNDNHTEIFDEEKYAELLKSGKVVAIGECGLDYFRIAGDREAEIARQKELFKKQIEFALKYDLPLMLHCRDSYADVLEILNTYKSDPKLRGNSHFFAGTLEEAKGFVELGFTLSFTGVITFARDYDEVIKYLPLNMIMSETDAPFVAPAPYRGKRNESLYVKEVVQKIAEIKDLELEIVQKTLVSNAISAFRLS